MTAKPRTGKRSGSTCSRDAGDKDRLIVELKDRITVLENELRLKLEDATSPDFAKRKQAEDALSRLAAIVTSCDDAIIGKTLDGTITSWNKGAERIYGYSESEAVGKSIGIIIPPDHKQELEEMLDAIRCGERVEHHETVRVTKDGQRIDVSVTISPILDVSGNVIGASTIARDITGRKQADKALREAEEKFRLVADFTYDWEAWIGPEGKFIYVSPSCERITGHKPDEFYRDPGLLLKLIHPDDRAAYEHHMKENMIAGAGSCGIDFRIVTADGETRWVGHVCQPVYGNSGEWLGRRANNRDITGRKRDEKERDVMVEFLSLVNEARSTRELVQKTATFFQQKSDCEAVGIRLPEGDDYPYYEARGFSPEFIRKENRLCTRDGQGRVLRDKDGFPMLECMCGNIITGRFDPSKPFFTARGSFWTNSSTELLATATEKDLLTKTRNVCIYEGYESMALIPLRVGAERLGVLQLNDRRKGHFTSEQIAMWERLANYLAVALAKFRAEDVLRSSEAKFHALFENAGTAIFIADTVTGEILDCNAKAESLIGRPRREIIGLHQTMLHPPDQAEAHSKMFARHAIADVTIDYEAVVQHRDGQVIPVMINAAPVTINGREVMIGFFLDITERKQAEAELETANRALKAISKCNEAVIHTKEESVLLDDVCQIIVGVGGYRMAWVGYAENDAKKSVRPVACSGFEDGYMAIVNVTWEDTERGRGPVGSAVRTGKPCVIRYATTDPNFLPWRDEALKRGYNSVLGLPLVQDGNSLGALAIYSEKPDAFDEKEIILLQGLADNLTQGVIALRNEVKRKEAEGALKTAKAYAELYLDLMGHDINNMNQVGLGFLEMALDMLDLDEAGREMLLKPRSAFESSSKLIDNVRKLQKARSGEYQDKEMDIGQVLRKVQDDYSKQYGRGITINYLMNAGYVTRANELLCDLFSNLVENAIKHSRGHPVIDINVEPVRENGCEYYMARIDDRGPGIPDDLKAVIFERKLMGDIKSKGSGIGLLMVKTLIDSYNGRVWVEDRVKGDYTKGARFVVMLPAIKK